jgi:hypothetical protein
MGARMAMASCRLAMCALVLTATPLHAALSITFNGSVIRVTGVTPREQIAISAVMRQAQGGMIRSAADTQQLLTDTDGDGAVEYDAQAPIPPLSIWAAVDLRSGDFAVASPRPYRPRVLPLPPAFVKNAPADEFDTLIGGHMILNVLWVRPGNGGGAWFLHAADGGSNDTDHKANGRAVLSTAAFRGLESSDAPPKKMKKGDVIVVLDPFAMVAVRGVIAQ